MKSAKSTKGAKGAAPMTYYDKRRAKDDVSYKMNSTDPDRYRAGQNETARTKSGKTTGHTVKKDHDRLMKGKID